MALYAEVDALLEGCACACSEAGVSASAEGQCCYFGVTGREPYPTAVELEEVLYAMRAANVAPRDARRLPLAQHAADRARRPCPLLSEQGRCRVYASRPFGCRTFFCERRPHRTEVNALGRRIADLSARFAPRDPGPRPLVRALLADRPR
jgi:Fe-S-cluster containining protein